MGCVYPEHELRCFATAIMTMELLIQPAYDPTGGVHHPQNVL